MALYRHFSGRIATSFGIGTKLTPQSALNIVMKIISCSGQPVAKLSDSPAKTICEDEVFLAHLREAFSLTDARSKPRHGCALAVPLAAARLRCMTGTR